MGIPYLDMTDEEFGNDVKTVKKNVMEKYMIVISDTTPILSLLKAQKLDLLQKLYKNVIIPKAVYSELTANWHKEKHLKCMP